MMKPLGVLADCGIEFTILAPWQANTDNLDASRPYQVLLPYAGTIDDRPT